MASKLFLTTNSCFSKRFVKYDDDPLQELLGLSPLKDKKKTYKNMYEKQLHRKRYLKDENGM